MQRLVLGLASLIVAAAGLLSPAAARAADPALVLETSPLPISLVADPGKSVSADIRVRQAGSTTQRLQVGLMKFTAYGDEGKPELLDRGPADSYFDWVKFDKTQFDAPANVWQTVHMTITLPKTAAFGYYYAVTFSRVGDDVRRGNDTNSIAGATAVLVLLEARSPNAKRTLQLVSFGSTHRFYEFLPASFNVKLENTGNVHGAPVGNIFITKGKKQVAALDFNGSGGNILPGTRRVFTPQWTDGFPAYKYVIKDGKVALDKKGVQEQSLNWDWTQANKFRMGEYTAHLFAVYDDGTHDVPIEAEVTFWVIPWRILLALLVAITLIGFGVYGTVRGAVRSASRGVRRIGRRK